MFSALRLIVVGLLTFSQIASPMRGLPDISQQTASTSSHLQPDFPLFDMPGIRLADILPGLRYSGLAPVAVLDSYDLNEDSPLTVGVLTGVLANDTDNENDPLTVELPIETGPSFGGLAINSDGSFTYTPDENFNGVDTFQYRALDDTPAASNLVTVTLNVAPLNDSPVAVDDTGSTVEDVVLNVAAPGVLSNDSDIDLDAVTIDSYTQPAHGSVSLLSDGAYIYTPALNNNAADSFTYTIIDNNGGSDTATVNLTITPVNDAPVSADDSYSTNEDTPLSVNTPGVLANDSDVDSSMTAVLLAAPASGSLTLNASGLFNYTPALNVNGPITFTYRAFDGEHFSAPATVTINITPVNDPPASAADSYPATEDTQLVVSAPGLLSNDADVEGPLTAEVVSPPATGTLSLSSNGSFTYTPALNANGAVTFTYRAFDGVVFTTATAVTINIAAVNDAPAASNDTYSATEDVALNIAAPGVLSNDTDIEGSALTAELFAPPASGTLSLNANGSFNYTPALNVNGPVTFTYRAYDGALFSAPATVTINITPQPDNPISAADNLAAVEDTELTFPATALLGNDSDPDGEVLTVVNLGNPLHGNLVDNLNGTFTYTPDLNYNGTDSFTYRAEDPTSRRSSLTTVTITLSAVNDSPAGANDAYPATEDTPLTIASPGVLTNDIDVDSSLTAVLLSPPAAGSLSLNADGSFTYTPVANSNGAVTFTYRAYDGEFFSSPVTVTINIAAVNDAPTAGNDVASTNEDTLLTIAAPGLLSNDNDIDSSITAVVLAAPAAGTLNLNPNGGYTYMPAANANGVVTFTYRAFDGVLHSAAATVTITINAVPDAPIANPDSFSTNEDIQLVILESQLIANDTDGDNDPLDVTAFTQPTHGSVLEGPANTFTYTPANNYFGADSFSYTISDGSTTATASISLTVVSVNDFPTSAADSYPATEDTQLVVAVPGLLSNDTDVEGPLTAEVVSPPATGTLSLSSNGSFTYTPALNANGAVTFTYRAFDSVVFTSATTVTINIAAVNDAPAASNDTYSATEDVALNIAASGVLSNDTDVEGSALTTELLAPPASGTLTLNENGSFNYTPALNVNGPVTFTYRAYDGALFSAPATVTINLAAVNDAPVAVNDVGSTNEDTSLTVAAPGVLTNDSDVDNPGITAVLLAGPATGTLALNPNGGFTYTPAANAHGVVTFTYRAFDGVLHSSAATVTITINAVNDPPVAAANTYAPIEDTLLNIDPPGVLANDSDIDGDSLTASHVAGSGPTHGVLTLNSTGEFTYMPDLNYHGPDQFSYNASDGTANSNTVVVTLNVASVNDQPAASADAYTTAEDTTLNVTLPGVLQNDTDVDTGQTLTAVLVTAPESGSLTLNLNGGFIYTPAANFNGVVTFTYRANDGAGQPNSQSAPATVTITINPVNDAPVATDQNLSTPEDTLRAIVLAVSDVDTPVLEYTIPARSAHGTLTGTAPNLTYTPDLNYFGADSFTYTVSDGDLTDGATVTINVTAVNDAPVGTADTYTVNEDTVLTIAAAGVLTNDSDVDNTVITAVLAVGPTRGALTLNANGSFTYTPNLNVNGQDTFTYRVSDGTLQSPILTVTINITAINDLPVALGENYTTLEDVPLVVPALGVLGNDTDVDGDTLSPVLITSPVNGALVLNNNGSFTYTPKPNYPLSHTNVDDTFTYRVFDGTASSTATVTARITITAVNDPPYHDIAQGNYAYDLGQDGFLEVSANEGLKIRLADYENDNFTIQLDSDTAEPNDFLTVNSDGSFDYMPYPNVPSDTTFTFTIRANDAQSQNNLSLPIVITINIIPSGGPQLNWITPTISGTKYNLGVGAESFNLSVATTNCEPGCGVRYFRWDAVNLQFIEIGQSSTPPYTVLFDTSVLNTGFNEILAVAVDPDPIPPRDPPRTLTSPRRSIWLRRYPWPGAVHRTYMPGVTR